MQVLGSGILYNVDIDTLPEGRQSQSESQEIITVVLVMMSPAASLCLLVSLTSLLSHGSIKEGIPQMIVSGYSLALRGTGNRVITKYVLRLSHRLHKDPPIEI